MARIRRLLATPTRWLCCSLLIAVLSASTAFAQITVGSLANEIGDRDSLTVFPSGSSNYTQQQASSHDMRNGNPNLTSSLGRPWGQLNADFGNWQRIETNQGRQELVAFEDLGPGAITRWWTTGHNDSVLTNNYRIYLADSSGNFSESPDFTLTANDLTGRNGVSNALGFDTGLNYATPLRGGNSYGPITYQHGVKVTWDGPTTHNAKGVHANILDQALAGSNNISFSNAVWYNINYRKYEPGTVVEDFSTNSTSTYASELSQVNARLISPATHGHVGTTDTVSNQQITNGGTLARNYAADGGTNGQAIREISLNFNGENTPDHAAALANTFVELIFDGQTTARIPIGQFFGNGFSSVSGGDYNDGGDYFRSVGSDQQMTARWVMPFQNSAEVKLINGSGQAVEVDLEVKTGDYHWSSDSMHFHADFRSSDDIKARAVFNNNELGDADVRFLNARGQGLYVGDTMSIRNIDDGSRNNHWWGEGDEKIYVDYLDANGEGHTAAPVHLGTGTEDYYGYSFGWDTEFGINDDPPAEFFTSPFVAQPNGSVNLGPDVPRRDLDLNNVTINSRIRGLDAIPFHKSFKFDMEVWKWAEGSVDIGAATFWYGEPGAVSLNTVADLAGDFQTANNGETAEGIADATGAGQWGYYKSNNPNPSAIGADLQALVWGDVGNAGNQGYGGGESGDWNVAAISDEFLFVDGGDNIGIQGGPGYQELALHPGGAATDFEYVVARWTAGIAVDGLVNIAGSIRNLVNNSDSVEFFVYVDGVLEFSVDAAGTTLDETYFDFDSTISPGQSVDFVVGNGGADNPFGDESILKAIISADYLASVKVLPVRGDLDDDGVIGIGDWQILRDNLYTPVGDLNDDGINDIVDFGIFKQIYISANGPGSFSRLFAVPEPTAIVIMTILLGVIATRKSKWSCHTYWRCSRS